MSLSAGTLVGPYEIRKPLGAGGMGEVYLAFDPRLKRNVAIKVLPDASAHDPERLARSRREAELLAALNHPHIAAIYGVEEVAVGSDRALALVMEFVDGETLADRLTRGLVPVDEALTIAVQIAEALESAHQRSIVHRDLKPANIALTRDGNVKILDFGLATLASPAEGEAPRGAALSLSPTITSPALMTGPGVILGTAAYMSPEQAKGRPADHRSDIWSFGCVLFEMLSGRRPFGREDGGSAEDVIVALAAVIRDEPEWKALPPSTPAAVRHLLTKCLRKDPYWRLQHIGDARVELHGAKDETPDAGRATPAPSPSRVTKALVAGLIGFAGAAAAVGVWVDRSTTPQPEPEHAVQFELAAPAGTTFGSPPGGGTGTATQLAVSPDGRRVAFVANKDGKYQLWVRSIDSVDVRTIPGTDGAAFPFWSSDSTLLAFFADGKLKRASLSGGPVLTIADAPSGRGGTWNTSGDIVFAPNTRGGLKRVSASGGAVSDVSTVDEQYGETSHRLPFFLPDSRHFIYTAVVGQCCPAAKPARIRVGSLDERDGRVLLNAESSAVFSGRRLFYRVDPSGALMARTLNPSTFEWEGESFPVADEVGTEGSRYASFSMAGDGTLVYARSGGAAGKRLTWFNRSGQVQGTVSEAASYRNLALSSDDRRLAVSRPRGVPPNQDIFIIDIENGNETPLTYDPTDDHAPVWSPDDTQIAYGGQREGQTIIFVASPGLPAKDHAIVGPGEPLPRGGFPLSWSPDGGVLLFDRAQGPGTAEDVWAKSMLGDGQAMPYIANPTADQDATFAPDGKWVAYTTETGGRPEIFVQPFPANDFKVQISENGGVKPMWRRDGRELFYITADGRSLMAVSFESTGGFKGSKPNRPVRLFAVSTSASSDAGQQYAVSKDGHRFLINMIQEQTAAIPLTVVLNWSPNRH